MLSFIDAPLCNKQPLIADVLASEGYKGELSPVVTKTDQKKNM